MGGTTQNDSVNEDELNCGSGAWDCHGLCMCARACLWVWFVGEGGRNLLWSEIF